MKVIIRIADSLDRIGSSLADIAESLAILSCRKKPYEPTFEETFGFGDTACERAADDDSVQVPGD